MNNEIDKFLYDTPEEIQMCLECPKSECTNCLWKKGLLND